MSFIYQRKFKLNLNVAATGTAFEGLISLPKPKGVKHGWIKFMAYLTGNRFLIHPIAESKNSKDPILPACFAIHWNDF